MTEIQCQSDCYIDSLPPPPPSSVIWLIPCFHKHKNIGFIQRNSLAYTHAELLMFNTDKLSPYASQSI